MLLPCIPEGASNDAVHEHNIFLTSAGTFTQLGAVSPPFFLTMTLESREKKRNQSSSLCKSLHRGRKKEGIAKLQRANVPTLRYFSGHSQKVVWQQ